ncbi:MAG: hypothetical protein ACXQTW_06630 [Candidatus Methanospirareceae archaeon]
MDTRRRKIEAIAITAMIAISVFAGIILAMAAPSAIPEDTDGVSNVVPGEDCLRGDEIKWK